MTEKEAHCHQRRIQGICASTAMDVALIRANESVVVHEFFVDSVVTLVSGGAGNIIGAISKVALRSNLGRALAASVMIRSSVTINGARIVYPTVLVTHYAPRGTQAIGTASKYWVRIGDHSQFGYLTTFAFLKRYPMSNRAVFYANRSDLHRIPGWNPLNIWQNYFPWKHRIWHNH